MPPKKSTLKTIFTPVMVCGCGCGPSSHAPSYASSRHQQPPKPRRKTPSVSKTPSPFLSPSQTAMPAVQPSSFHRYKYNAHEAGHDLGLAVSPRLLSSPCPKLDESVAVAKESINPFEDFRWSMKQMIEARDIETEDDLKELLRCFLDINPPPQHNVIVRAFVDVCSIFRTPQDRHGRSLGSLLRLNVKPVDESHNARQ